MMKSSAVKKVVKGTGIFGLYTGAVLGMTLGLGLVASSAVFSADYVEGYEAAANGDYKKAAAVWFDLAKKGDPEAQFNLALAYHSGVDGSFNEPEALKWYNKAANAGHTRAQEYLATGYREGWFGLQKDTNKARFWEAQLNN